MKSLVAIFVTLFVLTINLSCEGVSSNVQTEKTTDKSDESSNTQSLTPTFSKLKDTKIKIYGEWDIGEDSTLIYLVEKGDKEEFFLITDRSGKVLYKNDVNEVQKVYYVFALRTAEPQLVFEYNEGGGDSYVQMFEYSSGNISELIDQKNGENSFGADVKIQPQFRSGINPAKEPFEILLTDYGLASSAGKFTKVLRYKDKKYRYIGRFDREKTDDYKEKILIQ